MHTILHVKHCKIFLFLLRKFVEKRLFQQLVIAYYRRVELLLIAD